MTPLVWDQGRATIERLLRSGEIERVGASTDHAEGLLDGARVHLSSAASIASSDPDLAYGAAYDSARKALTGDSPARLG